MPVIVSRAHDAIIEDIDGNRIIDMGSGIGVVNVGNSAPRVVKAVQEAVANFTHTNFTTVPYMGYIEVCEALNRLTPGKFKKKSILQNSGAEAVENAIKIARHYTKRPAIVVFEHAYHGRTNLTMALTAKNMPYKDRFGPFAPEVYRVPTSYPYRDGLTGAEAAARAIAAIESSVGAHNVAAILIEPIQGEGGFIVPAAGFLPALVAWTKANGALFIADEIQTGFCRTGEWFAVDHEGVIPDIVTTAKGLAGGMPLAGVTGRAEIMNAVHEGGLGGTYGGNPVAAAAALATIKTLRNEKLHLRAREIEALVVPILHAVQAECATVGDIRGRGAMLVVEFVEPGTKTPNAALTKAVIDYCTKRGVVVISCGTYGNCIRLLPSLTITDEQLRDGLGVLVEGIRKLS